MEGYGFTGWFVMLLGMGTVFVGLIGLIYVTMLMSYFCGKKKERPVEAAIEAPAAVPQSTAIANRPQFVAAIAAAIATHMETDPERLRIHSIKRMDGADVGRGALVAAISAAIAADMGTDVSGIRIHSLKRV